MSAMLSAYTARALAAAAATSQRNRSLEIAKAVACVLVFGAAVGASQPASAQQFNQQGSLLVGTGAEGAAEQGASVALSGNGNTAAIGGPNDNLTDGAVWIFTRSNGVWTQQAKLQATGSVGFPGLGMSVALSSDGNTLLAGGPNDNGFIGAVWVFTQSGGVWTQQAKLTPTGNIGSADFGTAVALSSDGNTALVGGPENNAGVGAAWLYTRSGSVWTQQTELTVTDNIGVAFLSTSVALSGDAMIAVAGGPHDNAGVGAAWVFTQSGGSDQQRPGSQYNPFKLEAIDEIGAGNSGAAVAVTGPTPTGSYVVTVGAPLDNPLSVSSGVGATFMFTGIGAQWPETQKFVPTGSAPGWRTGISLEDSLEFAAHAIAYRPGTETIVGAPGYTAPPPGSAVGASPPNVGAVLVLTGSGGNLVQRAVLTVPALTGNSGLGTAVALSGDGNTAIFGARNYNSNAGAAVIFWRNPVASHDYNGDGYSDILWRDTSGDLAVWLMNGGTVSQSADLGSVTASFSIIGQHDFNGLSDADILWRDTSGNIALWFMTGTAVSSATALGNVPTNWAVYGTGDLNGDGVGDLLWRDANTGTVVAWFMNGAAVASTASFGAVPGTWTILGDADGTILWRDSAGDIALWGVQNGQVTSANGLGTVTSNFVVQGVGDFNGDGFLDILWRDTNTGTLSIWFTNGTQVTSAASVGTLPSNWNVAQIGDYNGDGNSDILLLDSAGDLAVWLMHGATVSSSLAVSNVGSTWQVQNSNAN